MFSNELEEGLMRSLMSFFDENHNKSVIIEWKDGTKIKVLLDTFYETDNGLEIEEDGYEEYYACAITIQKVINLPNELIQSINYPTRSEIKIGVGTEISYHNAPERIYTLNREMVWEK